jgi:hypothetical protein
MYSYFIDFNFGSLFYSLSYVSWTKKLREVGTNPTYSFALTFVNSFAYLQIYLLFTKSKNTFLGLNHYLLGFIYYYILLLFVINYYTIVKYN